MEMASFCLKIRHVFGFTITLMTERSIGAGPPVIGLIGPYQDKTVSRAGPQNVGGGGN